MCFTPWCAQVRRVAAGDASAERKLQVGGNVLTLLFIVQLVIMIWKPGIWPEHHARVGLASQTSRPERLHRSVEEATEDHHGGKLCDQRPALASAPDRRPEAPSTPSKARPAAAHHVVVEIGLGSGEQAEPDEHRPDESRDQRGHVSSPRRW